MPAYTIPPWRGPLAPIAPLRVFGKVLGRETSETVRALLDSGADYTEVPVGLARSLGLRRSGEKIVLHSDGNQQTCPMFWARVELDGRVFELNVIGNGIRANGEQWALVGRDILNQAVVIDGPGLRYDVAPATVAPSGP